MLDKVGEGGMVRDDVESGAKVEKERRGAGA